MFIIRLFLLMFLSLFLFLLMFLNLFMLPLLSSLLHLVYINKPNSRIHINMLLHQHHHFLIPVLLQFFLSLLYMLSLLPYHLLAQKVVFLTGCLTQGQLIMFAPLWNCLLTLGSFRMLSSIYLTKHLLLLHILALLFFS